MRISSFRNNGINDTFSASGFSNNGGSVSGSLILVGDPTQPLEASTKQYVDGIVTTHVTDLALHISSSQNTLLDGITATTSNINNLSGIGSNLQTLLDTKASIGGGTFSGFVTLHADPTSVLHIVTKSYVDSSVALAGSLAIGDISKKPTNITPVNFLRANGAEVSKTTYSALFAVIGETFLGFNPIGSGKPWKQQYDINLTQSTDITGWTTGTSLPTATVVHATIVTKNRVYVIGGQSAGVNISTVQTAPINTDGTLGAWTLGTPLPATVIYSQAIVTKNRVYLLGGYINGAASAVVYTAPINADGTLGTWTTGTSLPGTVQDSQAIVTKNRVYLLGGWINSIISAVVYTAPINTDGTLGTWTTGTSLPGTVFSSQAIVTKNRVYILGGRNSVVWSAVVYTAPINTDGTLGTWVTGTPLPSLVGQSQAIVTKNRVYLLGGAVNNSQSAVVHSAPILGGLNDYSPYYDGTILATDPLNFNLPDLTVTDANNTPGINSFIRAT